MVLHVCSVWCSTDLFVSFCCCMFFICCFFFFALHREIFDEDNYAPVSCQNEDEYNAVLKEFPFDDSKIAQVLCNLSTMNVKTAASWLLYIEGKETLKHLHVDTLKKFICWHCKYLCLMFTLGTFQYWSATVQTKYKNECLNLHLYNHSQMFLAKFDLEYLLCNFRVRPPNPQHCKGNWGGGREGRKRNKLSPSH